MNFKKIAVIGGGTMGQGIAEMLSHKGLDVYLMEKTEELLSHSFKMIELSLDKQIEKWAITETEKKLILSRLHKLTDPEQLGTVDMVIEAITEDLELKKQVLRELEQYTKEDVLFASNTSTLSLTEIASVARKPERVIGLHFLHPVSRIDLVEIVRGLRTSEETFHQAQYFVENVIHKKGVMVFESPGYVTTRLICVLINEALLTLQEGVASAEDIDSAMRIGYDFRYGPLEMCDRFGLDSVLASMERMFREYGELKYRPSVLLKKMVRAGHLGVKTGEGFFKYDRDGDRIQ